MYLIALNIIGECFSLSIFKIWIKAMQICFDFKNWGGGGGQHDSGYQALMGPLTTSQLLLLLQGIIMNCSVLNHVYWKEYRYFTVYSMLFAVYDDNWYCWIRFLTSFWLIFLMAYVASAPWGIMCEARLYCLFMYKVHMWDSCVQVTNLGQYH